MWNFLWRTPFAIFGAFGLLSLSTGSGVLQVDSNIEAWIIIWKSITRPIWETIFWPIETITNYTIPKPILDYLSMGFVFCGMSIRAAIISETINRQRVFSSYPGDRRLPPFLTRDELLRIFLRSAITSFLFWPFILVFLLIRTIVIMSKPSGFEGSEAEYTGPYADRIGRDLGFERREALNFREVVSATKIYWETFTWFVIVIAINYALLFKDGELRFGARDFYLDELIAKSSSEFTSPSPASLAPTGSNLYI